MQVLTCFFQRGIMLAEKCVQYGSIKNLYRKPACGDFYTPGLLVPNSHFK